MCDNIYNCFVDLMVGMKRTFFHVRHYIREAYNSGKSSTRISAYKIICQIFISSKKLEYILNIGF